MVGIMTENCNTPVYAQNQSHLNSAFEFSPTDEPKQKATKAFKEIGPNGAPPASVVTNLIACKKERVRQIRNLASFWIFGLCNNFAYIVMLGAAHDILHDNNDDAPNNSTTTRNSSIAPSTFTSTTEAPSTEYLQCNAIGTGAILLANVLPSLVTKLSFPFFLQRISYDVKIAVIGLFGTASYIIVSFSHELWLRFLGVASASFGSGFGEITFLSLSTFFDKNVVSTWSSGTGGAGVFGALAYAGLTAIGLSFRMTVLVMISVPFLMLSTYRFLLVRPDNYQINVDDFSEQKQIIGNTLTFRRKVQLIPPLLKYMIPLSAVYFGGYFINQGLNELLYFNGAFLTKKEQYRWFQFDYQVGVFISRSSVNVFKIKKLWILSILQFANMTLLIFHVFYRYIPSLWIILAIILWEGLLGGAAYVNTFYLMSIELAADVKEYCMGIASVANSLGISLAGIAAIPTHNHICSLKLKLKT